MSSIVNHPSSPYYRTRASIIHQSVLHSDERTLDYVFLYVNPIFERMTGLSKEELVGKRVTEIPVFREWGLDWIEEYSKAPIGGEYHSFEKYIEPLDCCYEIHMYSRAKGFFETLFHDITKYKRIERELRESNRDYRSIVHSINEALYIHNFQGDMIFVNEHACQIMGYEREELLQYNIMDLNSEEERLRMPHHLKRLFDKGHINFEGEFVRKDGSIVPGEVSAKIVSWEGKGVIQSLVRDITARKKDEERIQKSERHLSLTLKSIGDGVITTNQYGEITSVNYPRLKSWACKSPS